VIPETTLFATPETAAEVARAPAVAILIGSYDGSGNYGDLAQLDAALELLAPLEPGILLLPVLERSRLADHATLREELLRLPARPLFFGPGQVAGEGLLPVPTPERLSFGACYLYGGGYLNPSWGKRKLAMLRAAEALLAAGGLEEVCRIASGLQVDAGWVDGLAEEDAALLRSFELFGVRDRASREVLARLGGSAAIADTGDDAIGVLRRLPAPDGSPSDGNLHVNVHVAEHEWVTGRPDAIARLFADLLAELGHCAGLPVLAQPAIAYLDQHVDERPMVDRLAEACLARGVATADPLVLRPAGLAEALPELRRAAVTLSGSYHVALTSLMLEVPAVLMCDNTYYAQKAAGLAEAFGLPPAFALDSGTDPAAGAREIAALVLDSQRGPILRQELTIAAAAAREYRANAEEEILARLSAGAFAALGELAERLRERSLEPARLPAQLARSTEDGAVLDRSPAEEPAEAQQPAAADDGARELLDVVLNSRSWRMTAPLRRAQALFRRRR